MFVLTTIAVIVTAIGVLATLIAPALWGRASLLVELVGVVTMKSTQPFPGLSLEVFHGVQRVESSVFVATVNVINTGSKDITIHHFVEPIRFGFGSAFDILSFHTDAPDGLNMTIEQTTDQELNVTWTILKKRESVSIRLFLKSNEEELVESDVKKKFHRVVRLTDVQLGPSMRRIYRHVLGVALGLALGILSVIGFSFVDSGSLIYTDTNGVQRSLYTEFSYSKTCRILATSEFISDCVRIDTQTADRLVRESSLRRVRVGEPLVFVIFIIVSGAVYGMLISLGPARLIRWMGQQLESMEPSRGR